MIRRFAPAIVTVVLLIGIMVSAFSAGWAAATWRKDAEIARLQAEHRDAIATVATEAASRLSKAQERGNSLQLRLAQAETIRDQLVQEKDREIRRLTVGRRCLDSAAVRVLNEPASTPLTVPAHSSEPVRANAAFATDTDVGIWIGQCRRSYDTCRGRLAAIAEFEAEGDR